jgi:hypothetical protein
MAETNYDYSIANDTLNGKVAPDKLRDQIQDSTIVTALAGIITDQAADLLRIIFKDALDAEDQITLTAVVAAHDGVPYPPAMDVSVTNFSTIDDPEREVQRVIVQPGRTGYYMCDRDIRVSTSIYEAADSFEDLKVNPADNKRIDWGEVSHVGCFKLDSGDYVLCTSQADADANAVLSVWDYIANDQTQDDDPVDIDLKGGTFYIDSTLADDADKWKHQIYAMLAPNIPAAMGGQIVIFDGYMWPYRGCRMETINTMGLKIDPSQSVEAARLRVWIYHPAGVKLNHVLRLITFRTSF